MTPNTPKSFWSYQASTETPDAPAHIAQSDWEKLSPGMRREIKRTSPQWWQGAAAAIAGAVALVVASIAPASADSITTACRSYAAGGYFTRACTSVVERDPPPAAAEPPGKRGPGTVETVEFDPVEAARRLAIPKHDPDSVALCPPGHMTPRDGCR